MCDCVLCVCLYVLWLLVAVVCWLLFMFWGDIACLRFVSSVCVVLLVFGVGVIFCVFFWFCDSACVIVLVRCTCLWHVFVLFPFLLVLDLV